MAYLAKAKKIDLISLAEELNVKLPDNAVVVESKELITKSEYYDEEFTRELLKTIISTREERCALREHELSLDRNSHGMSRRGVIKEQTKNECFTTGSYNNKYCGYTQWRAPIQIDKRCFVCNQNSHFARDCPKQKYKFDRINRQQNFKWRGEGIERNEGNHVYKRDHSLMTDSEGGMSKASSYIKIARINKCPLEFTALIDTGSDSVICRNSVAKRLELKIDPASNVMYGFGNIKMCAARALAKAKWSVKVKGVKMLIVRDDALPHDLLIGRSLLDRENISFARIGNKFHVCYAEDNPFANMECERNSVNFVRAQTTLANDGSENQCVGTVIELDPNCFVNEESCYVDVIKENKRLIETSKIRLNKETPIEDKREILELGIALK
ncbi:CCHC-type domain-containing protein [Caerostris darwini]|uniref:CCHC-type domain-containing protein n=1 Tax=Caerostris darwini TaxID=1538125 RepID=A0AAV4NAV5_9ARAC|nr:CCHC-type domain-containing protein [Caerostris darwini]